MSLADKSAANVARLLKKYGEIGSLVHRIGSAYNPATGQNVVSQQTLVVTVYVSPVSAEDMRDATVLRTDSKFIMSVSGAIKPSVNDTITVRGIKYNVKSSAAISVSGRDVLFKGIIRV